MTKSFPATVLLVFGGLVGGCSKAWQMDYGQPVAQFVPEEGDTRIEPVMLRNPTAPFSPQPSRE